MTSDSRRGVSLIEVLVVVFLVGFLLALLLSALIHAREAARRTQCASNLKNVGLGLNHFISTRGTLPSGVGEQSVLWSILPFIGEEPRYSPGVDGKTIAVPVPSVYLCPSDSARRDPDSRFATNYAGNAGVVARNPPGAWEGVFAETPIAARDVTDGLSLTVAVSEWIVGDGDRYRASRLGSIHILDGEFPDTPGGFDHFQRSCEAISGRDPGPALMAFKGAYWYSGHLGASLYTHALPPDQPSCRAVPDLNAITAGSLHGGGGNVLMLDGTVRFVKDSIAHDVWRALATRAGGEAAIGDY
ncbi:DUF1559 family PulG-like putative transporter [Paludisphaera rhizosphaerae]|uniref:DUF1559 family PulG-like putative transporter n=1 Tax=Paludisphaera rhizosphaerae TaxID=2711216 RepID=UPI0013EE2746|nr:DUF1559 domain-containing protein [Paludisphaera rhizosphaerae]